MAAGLDLATRELARRGAQSPSDRDAERVVFFFTDFWNAFQSVLLTLYGFSVGSFSSDLRTRFLKFNNSWDIEYYYSKYNNY